MKRWLVGAVAALSIVMTSACSITTDTDEVGLDYDYDSWSGETSLEGCVMPGQRAWQDINDLGVAYPASQRTFRFDKGGESDPISVVSKDNLDLSVAGVATFDLNRDCKVLQQFHEKIGKKYTAEDADGWNAMLKDYIKQPIDRALDAASKSYDWKDLYTGKVKQAWETEVSRLATQFISEQAGAAFFVNFRFTLQQPQPPDNVRSALAAAQQAIEENAAQKNKNEQVRTELESIKDLVKVLGPNGYVLYEALKRGQITVVPVPADGSVNVSPR